MNVKEYLPRVDQLAHSAIGLYLLTLAAPLLGLALGVLLAWAAGIIGERFDRIYGYGVEDWTDIVWTGAPASIAAGWLHFTLGVPALAPWLERLLNSALPLL